MMVSELKYSKDVFNNYIYIWRANINQEIVNKYFIRFTYYSNKIVNKDTKLCDVESIFNGKTGISLKGNRIILNEIRNHKEIYEKYFKLGKIGNGELSIDLIKNFHYILMKDCYTEEMIKNGEQPGHFHKEELIDGSDGKKYRSTEVETQNALMYLIKDMSELQINKNNALEGVIYFYCWFLKDVHPFTYGNGRLARILMNYLLIAKNLPPILFFENDIEKYYSVLNYFNETGDISEMVDFLKEQAYKTWIKNYHLRLKSLKDFLDE